MKCVFFGLTTLDILNYLKRFPSSNEKVRAAAQLIFAGGPAANAAVTCSALGSETLLITGLGRQDIAELARQDLLLHGVEVVDLSGRPEDLPVLSTILIDESSGDRCVVYTNTSKSRLLVNQDYTALLAGADLLMLDGHYSDAALVCVQAAKALGIKTVLDGGSWKSGLQDILPYIDYAICSADFYPPGCQNTEAVVACLRQAGVNNIAITGGGEAIRVWQQEYQEVPVKQTKVVDTLGAGDILHGAFCHYLVDDDFHLALEFAAKVATSSCRYRGTRQWIKEYRRRC